MKRREFIASNLAIVPFIHGRNKKRTLTSTNMNIKFYCPRWGAEDTWESFCKRVKEAGYDGIETPASSFDFPELDDILAAAKKYKLEIIGQYYQSFESDPAAHEKNYEQHLRTLAALRPVFINAQTGKDFFSYEQNVRLFEIARKFSKETGIPVVHETHRGKALFAAHITRPFLERNADLRLTLDISHWCNVHESLLHDQTENVELALTRTAHLHSRVGHPEGPQVNDPRAPEWKETVDVHLRWWDTVVEHHRRNNSSLTITTEFGPAGYLPVLPYTQQPVADQWQINVYMLNLLKNRYNR
jgi:sugar phosphate isomerase/epimerase